jgi:DNA polymerase-3 subunit gamma/tau
MVPMIRFVNDVAFTPSFPENPPVMSYTVLARRYRSGTFDQVVGQNHIAQTLKKAIESGRIAHAYLFCGTRGTGKTSTARILAKCLNCQSAASAVTEPCGQCDSCKAIARGEDIDVIEIDAASNTGVDNVRDAIIGSAYNTPARSRYKVFIIDEVHMLSKQAFNALLKTLEEPPSHVKFILATTEPEKVLATILSRCQRYDFRNIGTREIAEHLKGICELEKIDADADALLLVAKAGAGSMRDSLSLLDRLLSVGEKNLTVEMIEQLLGMPKSQLIFDLAASIANGDVRGTLAQADSIITNGLSVDQLIASIIDHLRNLMVLATCGPESKLVEVPGLSLTDLAKQAGQFDPAALSQDIVILEELRRHVRQSQAGRALLDATLVRLTLADQFANLGDLLARTSGNGAQPAQKKKPPELSGASTQRERSTSNEKAAEAPSSVRDSTLDVEHSTIAPSPLAVSQSLAVSPPHAAPPVSAPPDFDDDDDDLPAPGKVWDNSGESLAALLAKQTAATPPTPAPPTQPDPATSNTEPANLHDLTAKWSAVLALLNTHGPALNGLLVHGQFIAVEDGQAVVRYGKQHETFVKLLERNGKKDLVRDALSQVLEHPVGVRFEVATAEIEPIPAPTAAPKAISPPARTASAAPPPPPVEPANNTIRITDEVRTKLYKDDPLIRAIVDQLGGTIIKLEE